MAEGSRAAGLRAICMSVAAIALNCGARSVTPIIAHVVCDGGAGCDPARLAGSAASASCLGDLAAQAASAPLGRGLGGSRLLALSAGGLGASLLLVMLLLQGPLSAFLLTQLVFGFWCGLCYPAAHALLAEEVPASRKSLSVSLVASASALGTMFGNFATPLTVEALGCLAPLALFAASNLALAACIASALRNPASAAALSSSAMRASTRLPPPPTPAAASRATAKAGALVEGSGWVEWRSRLADPLVQALVIATYAGGIANTFVYSFLPTLFIEVYGAQVRDLAGLITWAPLARAMVCVLSGIIADRIVGRYGWRTLQCRRLMQFLGTALPAASLLTLAMASPALGMTQAACLVTIWLACHGFQTAGLTASFHDVGGPRASELLAISNIFAKLAGVFGGQAFSLVARALSAEAVLVLVALHYALSGIVLIARLGRMDETRLLLQRSASECSDMPPSPQIGSGPVADRQGPGTCAKDASAQDVSIVSTDCSTDDGSAKASEKGEGTRHPSMDSLEELETSEEDVIIEETSREPCSRLFRRGSNVRSLAPGRD